MGEIDRLLLVNEHVWSVRVLGPAADCSPTPNQQDQGIAAARRLCVHHAAMR
jgi:hypothetical protein